MRTTVLVFGLSILAFGSTVKPAAAATASASLSVSATVQASCVAEVIATGIRTNAPMPETASAVSVACSNSVPYNVSLAAKVGHGTAGGILSMTVSTSASMDFALGPNLMRTANGHRAMDQDTADGFGDRFALRLAIRGASAAECGAPGADLGTMIVVVTY